MTDDRRRRPQGSGGWTPQDLGLSAASRSIAALTAAAGFRAIAGRMLGNPNRYPRPLQGSTEQRRRLRQQDRLTRKRSTRGN